MSYSPNKKQIEDLIKGLKDVPFFEWATRPLGFHFWDINQTGYYKYYSEYIGARFNYVFILRKGNYEIMYRNKKQHQGFIDNLQKKLKDYEFLINVEEKISKSYSDIWSFAEVLQKTIWSKVSNKKLADVYQEYHDLYAYWVSGVSAGILIAEAMASDLMQALEIQAKEHDVKDNIDLAVRILSTPNKLSMLALEEYKLLTIRETLEKKDQKVALKRHEKKWNYIPIYSQFESWAFNDFIDRMKSYSVKESANRYQELKNHRKNILDAKNKIFRTFYCDDHVIKISNLLSKYIYLRINDETTIGLLTRNRNNLMKEITKRLHISQKQLEHMFDMEIINGLTKEKFDINLINERLKGYAVILNPRGVAIVSGANLKKIVRSTKLIAKKKPNSKATNWQGTPANPGKVKGKVKVVLDPSLIGKIKKGNILVTTNTTPAYVVAMKISSAIVTEEGGITSHAAIVSRELGIPCIIGVPDITRILKDGDKVEVDATKGIIRKV